MEGEEEAEDGTQHLQCCRLGGGGEENKKVEAEMTKSFITDRAIQRLVFSGIFPPGRNDSCCGGAKEGGGGEEGKSEGRAGVYIQHDESDEDCCLHEEHPAWRRRALLHTVNCLLQSRRILQWEEEERDGKLSSSSSSAVISSSPSNSPRESYTTTALACLLGGEENEEGGDEDLRLLLDNLVKLRFESAAESSEHSDLQVSSSSSEKGEADKTLLDNDVAPRDLQIMERLLFGENEARPSFPQESSHSNLSARRCEVQEEGGSSSSWGEDFFSGEIEKNEESLRCIRSWKGGGEGSSLDSERTRDEEEEEEEERAVQRVRRRTCHLASRILVSFIDDSFDTNVSSDPEEDWRLHLSPKSLQETPLENTGDASSFYDVGQDEDGKGARTAWREEGAGRGIGLGRLYTAVPVDLSRYVSWQSLLGVLGDAFVEDDDACARRDADGDVARMMKLQEEEKQKEKDSVTIKALQSANASLLQEIADLKNQLSQRKSVEEQEKEGRGRGGDSGRVVMSGTQAGGTKNASERADEDQSKTSRISAASASLAAGGFASGRQLLHTRKERGLLSPDDEAALVALEEEQKRGAKKRPRTELSLPGKGGGGRGGGGGELFSQGESRFSAGGGGSKTEGSEGDGSGLPPELQQYESLLAGGDIRPDIIQWVLSMRISRPLPPPPKDGASIQLHSQPHTPQRSPSIGADDIAGLHRVKKLLTDKIINPILRPELHVGLHRAPRGILLFGPPGTGKTTLAKWMAASSGASFFEVTPSSVISKFHGETETLIKALFKVAEADSPSLVFIDEIDSLLGKRREKEDDTSIRMKNQLLQMMDGVSSCAEDSTNKILVVVGATNRPDMLDEAAIRRLSKRVLVPLPDLDARRVLIRNVLQKQSSGGCTLTEEELRSLASRLEGWNGSDIRSLCVTASERSYDETVQFYGGIQNVPDRDSFRPISYQDFLGALEEVRPSCASQESLKFFDEWAKTHGAL